MVCSSCLSRRVLKLSLPLLLLLQPALLLLGCPPLVLSVLEGPQFDALGDLHLVDALELEVGVDGVEEVELVFGNEGVFWIGREVREYTISLRFGRSFVLRIS